MKAKSSAEGIREEDSIISRNKGRITHTRAREKLSTRAKVEERKGTVDIAVKVSRRQISR